MCTHTIFTSIGGRHYPSYRCVRSILQISMPTIYGTLFWLASGTIDNGHDPDLLLQATRLVAARYRNTNDVALAIIRYHPSKIRRGFVSGGSYHVGVIA